LTESKVALASDEQLASSFRQQRTSLGYRIGELSQLVAARRNECSSFVSRKGAGESEIQDSQSKIERLQHEREQVNAQAAELIGQKNSQDAEISQRDESLRSQRSRLTEIQNQRGALDVELAQKNMSVQNLREKVQQKYHLNLEDIRSECITITHADEGPAQVETLTPEQMAEAGVATDWNSVQQQVEALQQKIDEMGPVISWPSRNTRRRAASSIPFHAARRFGQRQDAVARNHQPHQYADEDDVRGDVREDRDNFRAMFVDVFGGGKADLILSDENGRAGKWH